MIRYHGGPCTPIEAALELWAGRHALISFAYPQQIDFVAKHAFSFAMDNGAFSAWEHGSEVNWARSVGVEKSVPKRYKHLPPKQRALMMAFDADRHKSASRWAGSSGIQANMEFY